jgi:spore coat polysaccharide biosynthesis protein SpsF (cytidylyltransferase family)
MKTIGIVAAKAKSNRLPNKNLLEIGGMPLYALACEALIDCHAIDEIHLLTDIPFIHESIEGTEDFYVHERPTWTTDDSYPLQDVYKWFLYDKKIEQGTLVALMPTNPMIDFELIGQALDIFNTEEFSVLRSYGYNHKENGLYIVNIEYMLYNSYMYDVYTGAIRADGIEIHTEEEFNQIKEAMSETYSSGY